jgi:hypothetical protein
MPKRRWQPTEFDVPGSIVMGPHCPFSAHSLGSRDGNIPRYADSHACVRCVAGLTEGRVSLDVHRIHRTWRRRFLEFWSLVDIQDQDECWEWQGSIYKGRGVTYYPMARHWNCMHRSNFSAPRIAGWFTWGDFGTLPITHLCGNLACCNPLHIKVLKVPHFHHNRRLSAIDLHFDAAKLQKETLSFLELTKLRQPLRFRRLERINGEWLRYRLADSDTPLVGPEPEVVLAAKGRSTDPDTPNEDDDQPAYDPDLD